MSPLVGRVELPRDGLLERAYFIPGAEEMFWTSDMIRVQKWYPFALTFGTVDGPFTVDPTMPRVKSLRSTRYRAQIIIADNPLELQPNYGLPIMVNDHKRDTLLTVERLANAWGGQQVAPVPARPKLHVSFVCTYNRGRSVMAAAMFAHQLRARGLGDQVRVSSCGTWSTTWGNPMDTRGADLLRASGYGVPDDHRSAQFGPDHVDADLIVVMEQSHGVAVNEAGADPSRIRLLRSFGPDAQSTELRNPYTTADFAYCFDLIEAALPGLHRWVDARVPALAAP